MKKIIFNLIALLVILFFTGCYSRLPNSIVSKNEQIKNTNQPYEFVKYKQTDKAIIYSNIKVRGLKGKSITSNSDILFNDIMKNIYLKCDFTTYDLVETRIVSHKIPYFNEVWVFRDEKSKMKDKTTALGISMKQLPNGKGVDFFISGDCPAIAKNFVFTKE